MDFLSRRNDAAIRKELNGIRDSYHHYWDLLAELLQNSRDAITRKRGTGNPGPFFISVTIDPASNSIEVMDNGAGISADVLTDILAPGGGDKGLSVNTSNEVGEKGVGLTYAVFSCNNFSVFTRVPGQEVVGGTVANAQLWLNGVPDVARPTFETALPEEFSDRMHFNEKEYSLDSFTKIKVGAILPPEGEVNIFQMPKTHLQLLLRTRTAIGVTKKLFDANAISEFDVYLSINTPQGMAAEKIEAFHILPHMLTPSSSQVTLEATRDAFVSRADPIARRRFLQGKTVWTRRVENIEGWEINVYGAMFPDNDAIQQLSRDSLRVEATAEEQAEGSSLLDNGIFVGTKGMPTGLKLPPKPGTGRYPAYYKRCYFFVESPNLKFDLGRKSLHYRHVSRLQSAVAKVFSQFEEVAQYQGEARVEPVSPQITPAERRAAMAQVWQESKGLPDLNDAALKYQKHPNAQEAAVAAIFHELIGANILPSYHTLRTGYGERYDAHVLYVAGDSPLELIVEFKYALQSLVRDLAEKQKHFSNIDLLVAWDGDVTKLAVDGFQLDVTSNAVFEGVTHVLQVPVPSIDPIPVILLRTLLDRRKASHS